MKTQVSLSAHPKYLIASDLIAFLLILVVLLAIFLIPALMSLLAFGLIALCVGIGFGVDIVLWFRRGIRAVALDEDALTLHRGRGLAELRVERRAVAGVRVRRVIGRRLAVVRLRDGKPVRIPEDAFPPEAFARFLSALETWR
jgi:hypothetical protein